MSRDLGMLLRTRLLWAVLRAGKHEQLRVAHERGWLKLLDRVLASGEVQVLGGLGVNARLSAAHFPYWGAQAYGVLTGQHELMVQEALRRSLGRGGVFVDVGCNIGSMSLLGARLAGPHGRVIAVDAQRECVEATRLNAQLNGLDQVTAVLGAATAESGATEVIVTADSLWTRIATVGEHALERRRDRVEAIALDDLAERLALGRLDVVKIDVEGAELDVIAGMRALLRDVRPIVICEMHGKNRAFADAMREFDYRVVDLDSPRPIELAGENTHAFCEPWPARA